jgi:predicted DNA-binding protein
MLKTIGCKIPPELYFRINNMLIKTGITKSEFMRMLIDNYFKNHGLNG